MTGAPYTDQGSEELVCPVEYLNPVGRAPKWYTPGIEPDVVLMKHVGLVLGKLEMEEFSDTNSIPRSANKTKSTTLRSIEDFNCE